VRVVFAGTPDVAIPCLQGLIESDHEVAAVITRPPAAHGRGRAVQESPVAEFARTRGIEVFTPTDAEQLAEVVTSLAPDCCPVVAYGALIASPTLQIPRHGWVNVHFSLLPRWRGAAPVQWAIMSGDDTTGACTFQIETGLDTGPIFDELIYPLDPDATSGQVLSELSVLAVPMLVKTLDDLEQGTATPREQDPAQVTLAPKLTPADARIDWHSDAVCLDRRIRACTPAPGAWAMWGDDRVRFGPGQPIAISGKPGEVHMEGDRVLVGTGQGSLILGEVQPPGKRMIPAADWLRGVRSAVTFT
jgi:methionyl-tRNA formyltransferase